MKTGLNVLMLCVVSLMLAGEARGQFYNRPSNNVFQNVLDRPTVSPYLNLINPSPGNFDFGTARYQTLVRPQLEALRRGAATQGQIRGLEHQIRQVQQYQSTALQQTPMGVGQQAIGTGHPSVFFYYSHYYRIGNR